MGSEGRTTFRIETELNTRRKGANRIGLLGILISTLFVILGPAAEKSFLPWPFSGIAMLAGILGWIAAGVYFYRLAKFRRGLVEVDREHGVRFEGVTVMGRSEIKSAYFAPGSGRLRSCVKVLGEGERELGQIVVDTSEQAAHVIDTLSLGAKVRTAAFKAYSPIFSKAWDLGLLGLIVGGIFFAMAAPLHAPWMILLGLPIMIAGSYLGFNCNVHIGADGLLIGTRIAPQFIPWSEVESIQPFDAGVIVMRRDGKKQIRIPMAQRRFGKTYDYDMVNIQALVARAGEALNAYKQGAQPNVTALVARRGRSREKWIEELFAHLTPNREGSFRTAPILDDQLWTVVENPTAEASARAGAAAILARTTPESERSRFRIAADACTEPHLRVVLDQAASGASNSDVEKSLLALAEQEQQQDEQEDDRQTTQLSS